MFVLTEVVLEICGFKVSAIDLTDSRINSFGTNKVTSLKEYVMPLIHFLGSIGDLEKVCSMHSFPNNHMSLCF